MATKYTYHPNVTFPGNGWIEPVMDEESPLIEESIAMEICERLNEAAQDREDVTRMDWILDHATVRGGGDGMTVTLELPDHEDIRCAIDAARAAKGVSHG